MPKASQHSVHELKPRHICAEELAVPLDNKNWIGSLSKGHEVHEIVFRETDGAYDLDWHTAPCRQFIIMTNGLSQIHRRAWYLPYECFQCHLQCSLSHT